MRSSEVLAGALSSLALHPLRSLLTILGVVTGVAAVIAVIAAGEGSRRSVAAQIEVLGSRLLIVLPGPASGGRGRTDSLTLSDAAALEEEIGGVVASPEVIANLEVRAGGKSFNAPVVGAAPGFIKARNFKPARGRFFSPAEDRGRAKVAVIGPAASRRLFGDLDPVGKTFKLSGHNFRVIGTFESKGDMGWFHPDQLVVTPLQTAMTRVIGTDHLHAIAVLCPSQDDMSSVEERLVSLLRRRHRLPPGAGKDRLDFHVIDQREMIEAFAGVNKTLTALLISLAAVALVTGGVGIMNIMLVSVTERTPEIGIRKAVGASGLDIFHQFLAEAVILSGAGAVLGVGLGAAVSELVSGWGNWEAVISARAIVLSASAALVTGLAFGIYPAIRAASLEPVRALRSE